MLLQPLHRLHEGGRKGWWCHLRKLTKIDVTSCGSFLYLNIYIYIFVYKHVYISCTSLPSNPIHSEISLALILWDNHSLSWVLLQDLNKRKVVLSFNVLSLSTKTSEMS